MPYNILIIEDINSTVVGTIMDLQDHNFLVTVEKSVSSAIIALKKGNFDCVLLDWWLPIDNDTNVVQNAGYDALSAIRNSKAGENNIDIPVFIYTTHIGIKSLDFHYEGILPKTLPSSDVIEAILSVLAKRQRCKGV